MVEELHFSDPYVQVYDPQRKQIVRVPKEQAELLGHAGYAVGDEQARQMASDDGWMGEAKSFAAGVASGATANLSDLIMPESVATAAKRVAAVNPIANRIGQFVGAGGAIAATGGLGAVGGAAARVAFGAVSGGTEEYLRAKEHCEPVQVERILHGIGLGALLSGVSEGVAGAVSKAPEAAKGALGFLDEVYPGKKHVLEGIEEVPRSFRISAVDRYDLGNFKGFLGYKVLPNALKGPVAAVVAADKGVVSALNNISKVNAALDKYAVPAAQGLASTVRVLTEAGGHNHAPAFMDNPKEAFQHWRQLVTQSMLAPEAFAGAVAQSGDYSEHPLLQTGLLIKGLNQTQALFGALPKNPLDPTPGDTSYEPTTRQMRAFMEHVETVTNLPEAMKTPTRDKVALAEQTNPEQLQLLRDSLLGKVMRDGVKSLTPTQARNISIILGVPVMPQLNMQYLQTLQKSAPPPPPAKAPGGGGQLTPKGAQDVLLRDMTNSDRLGMRL